MPTDGSAISVCPVNRRPDDICSEYEIRRDGTKIRGYVALSDAGVDTFTLIEWLPDCTDEEARAAIIQCCTDIVQRHPNLHLVTTPLEKERKAAVIDAYQAAGFTLASVPRTRQATYWCGQREPVQEL